MAANDSTALVTEAVAAVVAVAVDGGDATTRYPDLPSAIARFLAASAPTE